ncbi:hypothetical protein C8F04DRAFT_743663 [Mycena alexandri]|uniref:Secreted protein n=1 Tax=Mycena alexandri TaxID=1745969 RepID=A0AAD6WYC3_9AGAR|nr:hypothetical protein C8F04DRAFT_743663 [Mycena alexandri]
MPLLLLARVVMITRAVVLAERPDFRRGLSASFCLPRRFIDFIFPSYTTLTTLYSTRARLRACSPPQRVPILCVLPRRCVRLGLFLPSSQILPVVPKRRRRCSASFQVFIFIFIFAVLCSLE